MEAQEWGTSFWGDRQEVNLKGCCCYLRVVELSQSLKKMGKERSRTHTLAQFLPGRKSTWGPGRRESQGDREGRTN
jgi:hypothetical protein